MSSSKRTSSGRPTAAQRSSVDRRSSDMSSRNGETPRKKNDAFIYECKAAYLVIFDEIEDDITSKRQLTEVLQQAGRNLPQRTLDKYWKRNTSSLTFNDFCDICHKEPATTEDDLMKAFRKVDINGDGYITHDELYKMMTTRGEKMTMKEVKAIIEEVDENRDGKLDYKEFSKMILSTQKEAQSLAHQRLERREKQRKTRGSSVRDQPDSPRSLRKNNGVDKIEQSDTVDTDDPDKREEPVGMGSQVSLRSATASPRKNMTKKKKELGSQTSLRSTSSVMAKKNNKMGSQTSLNGQNSDKDAESGRGQKTQDVVASPSPKGRKKSEDKSEAKPADTKEMTNGKDNAHSQKNDVHKLYAKKGGIEKESCNVNENGKDSDKKTNSDNDSDDDNDIVMGSTLSPKSKPATTELKKDTAPQAKPRGQGDSEEETDMGSRTSLRNKPSPRKSVDRRGSQVSVHSSRSAKSDQNQSPPKPKPRKSRDHSAENGTGDLAKSPRVRMMSPVALKRIKLPEPKNLKKWSLVHSKGCFFFEDDKSIVSHIYALNLPAETSVWITIEPFNIRPGGDVHSAREVGSAQTDTMLFILRERPDADGNQLVTFTEQRDSKGRYCVRGDMRKGKYLLVPFTTGCRFHRRKSEPKVETKLVKKNKEDKYVLTKAFRDALGEIFELCDLDGDGLMSKEEFNWFNLRTSGEEVLAEEWEVVEENVELKNGLITRKGFIDLNQMEADDNEGDTDDLWVTLSGMGYNKQLIMDEACPFILEVYTEDCEGQLKVIGVENVGNKLHQAVRQAIMNKGEAGKVKNMKDLFLHTYVGDFMASVLVENQSRSKVTMRVDCTQSKNVVSQRDSLDYTVEVPARSNMIVHHLLPANERQAWGFHCTETVVK